MADNRKRQQQKLKAEIPQARNVYEHIWWLRMSCYHVSYAVHSNWD